jgi:hypothetical protein
MTGDAACKMIGRCALAAVGTAVIAISPGTFGADLGTANSTATTVLSQTAQTGRRPTSSHPIVTPDPKPDLLAQRARVVYQLYEEIIRLSSPECSSATNKASVAGGC